MNRRTLLASGLAAAAVATPALADTRGSISRITTSQNASWAPEAHAHEHAPVARAYIAKLLTDRHLVAQTETWPIEMRVDFTRPSFRVEMGRVWDSHEGLRTNKRGPVVSIYERGVKVGEAQIYAYSGSLPEVPAVSMITRHLEFDRLKQALPGQVQYDNSRFFNAIDAQRRARRIEIA